MASRALKGGGTFRKHQKRIAREDASMPEPIRGVLSPSATLPPYDALGVACIVGLQKLAGAHEPEDKALRGWRGMDPLERETTLQAALAMRVITWSKAR